MRRAFLLGESEGTGSRKDWIEKRLEELAEIFAVSVGGFSVMDNHLHVLVRLDPDTAKDWSDEEVVRRWGRLFPPRDKARQPLPVSQTWVEWRLKDVRWVATARTRLQSLSWFMKCLKEPLSRLANLQDKTRGAFFEGRFKSVAILDDESLLATCTYIDLNPVAAGIVEVPEASPHTSITTRVEHVKAQGRTDDLKAAEQGSVAGSTASAGLEESIWLCPIEDRHRLDSSRVGMLEGFSLGSYLPWSTLPAGSSATVRPPSRPRSRESSSAWAAAWTGGRPDSRSSRAVDCWAGSSPPAATGCAKSPHAWVCITWRTSADARRKHPARLAMHYRWPETVRPLGFHRSTAGLHGKLAGRRAEANEERTRRGSHDENRRCSPGCFNWL